MLRYKRMRKEILLWEIELHYKQLSWTIQEIPVVESFLWSSYRLTVQSDNYILKWLHHVQKQPFAVIHFWKFLQEIPVVESFFWSNYKLTVQSGDYVLKWLHQECFIGNLLLGPFRTSSSVKWSHLRQIPNFKKIDLGQLFK